MQTVASVPRARPQVTERTSGKQDPLLDAAAGGPPWGGPARAPMGWGGGWE